MICYPFLVRTLGDLACRDYGTGVDFWLNGKLKVENHHLLGGLE